MLPSNKDDVSSDIAYDSTVFIDYLNSSFIFYRSSFSAFDLRNLKMSLSFLTTTFGNGYFFLSSLFAFLSVVGEISFIFWLFLIISPYKSKRTLEFSRASDGVANGDLSV